MLILILMLPPLIWQALLRPMSMMKPDISLIIEIMLFSEGFATSKILSKKMTTLYYLMEQQLSKQPHYDFGLRNILAVLRTAGTSLRAAKGTTVSEPMLIMRTLRDMNLSQFVAEDVPLFLALIDDLFPGCAAGSRSHHLWDALHPPRASRIPS